MLDELRKKPKAVRDWYAFLGAVGLTALITLVWALTLPSKLIESEPTQIVVGTSTPTTTQPSVSGLIGQFIDKTKRDFLDDMSLRFLSQETSDPSLTVTESATDTDDGVIQNSLPIESGDNTNENQNEGSFIWPQDNEDEAETGASEIGRVILIATTTSEDQVDQIEVTAE